MNIKFRKNSSKIVKNSNYTSLEGSHRHINSTRNLNYRCRISCKTYRLEILVALLVIFNLIESILCNPVFVDNPSIAQFQSGRNIRHLPCIVRKSGLSGTCMFAIDCIKQNGTHLGTCIDRFYFGSCCQMKEDIPFYAQDINDNSIDQNTISHFAHESSTVIPQTSSLFKLTTENFEHSSSESLLKTNSTKNKLTSQMPELSSSTNIPMQNRESTTKPQKIEIDLITTYKPVTKHNITGNLESTLLPTSSESSLLSTLILSDLPSSTLFNNESTSESVSLASTVLEASSITNITSQLLQSDSLSIESLSSQSIPSLSTVIPSSTSSLQSLSSLPLQTTTSKPDIINRLQTSTNPVLTTTKPTEKPFQMTTEESKFSTFQVVETTTPTFVSVSPTISQTTSSIPSSSSSKLPQTTYKPSSTKQPITTINIITNKPLPSRRPTTQRTKPTRRPTTTKPTVPSTPIPTTTRKPLPSKTTTLRTKPQQFSTTRRTTTTPRRQPTKRPTTISTLRPKPITKRPTTIHATTTIASLPKIDANINKNITSSTPIKNITIQISSALPTGTTQTKIKSTTTPMPLVPAATKAPRPKPKPTGNIVRVSPTPILDKGTDSISTIAPPLAVTNKPFLITGKPLTTKPIPTTNQPTKSSSTAPPIQISTTTTSTTLRPVVNQVNTSSKPNMTESPTESTTLKPSGLVTWTTGVDGPSMNDTDKYNDWVPRPPPDWVLLPTIKPDSDMNKTVEMTTILPPKFNVSTTEGLSNNSELLQTTPSSILTFTTFIPETSSKFTNLVNQSSTEGLLGLNTENSVNNLNGSTTTQSTITDMNTGDSSTISTTISTPAPTLEGLDYKQICGKRMFPEPRIVGGANAAFGRWPWQISLRQWRTSTYLHKCGAALLNENWAITAAHCVDNVPPSDLLLRLGEYDLAEEEEPYSYQERRVQIVASHPQFDPRTFEYDLALLRFYEPVAFQPNIIPVCVPDNDYDFLEQTAFVTGWGRLYEDGPLPSVLQEVSVPVINNTICETMYRAAGYIEHIPHIFICAGWKKGGYDSCEGDSGGPMVLQRDDKRFVLGGVISWGIGCAEPNQPGVYTRISEFRDWINQILQF